MTDRGIRKVAAAVWLGRIFPGVPMHMINTFSLGVGNWPGRRDATVMLDLSKIFLTQPEQRSAVKFGVAADVVVRMRMQLGAVRVPPEFLGVVTTVGVYFE